MQNIKWTYYNPSNGETYNVTKPTEKGAKGVLRRAGINVDELVLVFRQKAR